MAIIDRFPNDESLWLIRWIDEVRKSRSNSRSSSIMVLIERLDLTRDQVIRSSANEVATIFSQGVRPQQKIEVLIGYLPGLAIGQIYRNGKLVCDLPSSTRLIDVDDCERFGQDVQVRDPVTPPKDWDLQYAYPALSGNEFKLDSDFLRSRVLAFELNRNIYIIPRTTIFRTFYGCHSEMAKAFTTGNYITAMDRLACSTQLKSGLKTGIDVENNEWHIILNTLVHDDYARQIAILYFDKFAKKCAQEIYARHLQQRKFYDEYSASFITAKIPYTGAMTLRLSGFELEKAKTRRLQRFLVTSITGHTIPNYIPVIKYERYNSNADGEHIVDMQDEIYNPNSNSSFEPTPNELSLVSNEDPDSNTESFYHNLLSTEHIDAPPLEKIKKQSSQKFRKKPVKKPNSTNGKGSSGENGTGRPGVSRVTVGSVIGKPIRTFETILSAFRSLQAKNIIDKFIQIQPDNEIRRTDRAGIVGWNFLDRFARKGDKWPKRSWAVVRLKKNDSISTHLRSALIIEVHCGERIGVWIEIESIKRGGFLSPFLWNHHRNDYDRSLEKILETKGLNLGDLFDSAYKHTFIGDGICEWSVYKFLYKNNFTDKIKTRDQFKKRTNHETGTP